MDQKQRQEEFEERIIRKETIRQRIDNRVQLPLRIIDEIMVQMKELDCDDEEFMSLIIDKCFDSDRKAFFDKYLIMRACEKVMKRGGVVYSFQGEVDYKCYKLLLEHYSTDWLYKVPIWIIRNLAESYPGVRENVLPIRETKRFDLDWNWVRFYDGYLEITQPDNSDGMIFDKFQFRSPSIRPIFNSMMYHMKPRMNTVPCSSCMRQLRIDDIALVINISKLREEYERLTRSSSSNSYHGGGGWGPKSGTEYVSEHHRSGHWRTCASGKVVWVNGCTVSGHSRTY